MLRGCHSVEDEPQFQGMKVGLKGFCFLSVLRMLRGEGFMGGGWIGVGGEYISMVGQS